MTSQLFGSRAIVATWSLSALFTAIAAAGLECNEFTCELEGACCLGDGGCQITGHDDCAARGGVYLGYATTCAAS